MNICIIDDQELKVKIYTKTGIREFNFRNIAQAKPLLVDCMYISVGQQITYEELYNTVSQYSDVEEIVPEVIKPQKLCVVNMTKGIMALDIGPKDSNGKSILNKDNVPVQAEFRGLGDYKTLEEMNKMGFSDSILCQGLIKNGKLKILTISECNSIRNSASIQREKRENRNSILVDPNIRAADLAGGGGRDSAEIDLDSEIEEMDVSSNNKISFKRGGSKARSDVDISDIEAAMNMAESGLLPEDMVDGEQM